MKLKDAKISIHINQDDTTIELIDGESSITFVEITLSAKQLSMALSRLSHTPCDINVNENAIHKLNKKLEVKSHEFEIPATIDSYRMNEDDLHKIAISTCPEGWIPDKYYGSQKTFFNKGDIRFARVTIRRWI